MMKGGTRKSQLSLLVGRRGRWGIGQGGSEGFFFFFLGGSPKASH
jgi:hypothetical protein